MARSFRVITMNAAQFDPFYREDARGDSNSVTFFYRLYGTKQV